MTQNITKKEQERLRSLYSYQLLDTPVEAIFDKITELAASICRSPISAITLVDENRQWFKSIHGMQVRETPREQSFCAHTILESDHLEIADARKDVRFKDNELVKSGPGITHYAGVPLRSMDGHCLGALCVIDQKKKKLSAKQLKELHNLADITMAIIESRRQLNRDNEKITKYSLEIEGANERLNKKLEEEKALSKIFTVFNEMYGMLQFCHTIDEALNIVSKYAKQMFPDTSGGLYLKSTEADVLDLRLSWNDEHLERHVPKDGCWALRSSHYYYSTCDKQDVVCRHLKQNHLPKSYLCAPLVTHGETIGVLTIQYNGSELLDDDEFRQARQLFIVRLAKHVASAIKSIQLRIKMHELTIRDALTGAYNRRYLYDYFRNDGYKLVKSGHYVGIMILDVDFFKKINDTYGHYVGDEVLKQLAMRLNNAINEKELVCRLGGEEFVCMLEAKTKHALEVRAKDYFDIINEFEPALVNKLDESVTVSAGFALLEFDGDELSELLKHADHALYEAKATGKSRLVFAKDVDVPDSRDDI